MSCAPACAGGDYHLQWHWSQRATKQEGRRKATNNNRNAGNSIRRKAGRADKFKISFKMVSLPFLGNTITTSHSVHASHAAKVNTSTVTAAAPLLEVLAPASKRGAKDEVMHWQLMITKQRAPLSLGGQRCRQMCFPPSYWKLVSQTWSKLTAELVVQARIHRSSYRAHTYCPLPALIDTLMQLRNSIIFIDEALLGALEEKLSKDT